MSDATGAPAPLALASARLLAPLTTLQLGGPAAEYIEASDRETLRAALAHAGRSQTPLGILGGGSNLIVADAGFSGLVVRMATRGIELDRGAYETRLTAQAGEPWDELVELSVSEQLAGLECLSGIPGSTGATPIQNVGAYGQEVSDVIEAVELLDRDSGAVDWLPASACGFRYRDSRLKREPNRFIVLAVRFVLRTHGAPTVRYGELSRALAAQHAPTLREVQQAVRALRAAKGMLIDERFEASAGSFFTNPIVTQARADELVKRALQSNLISRAEQLPRFLADEGQVKLSAAWLIERAGIAKGTRAGHVGTSSRHALALVHHGGGTTTELLAFARQIQEKVMATFGVSLEIEPVRWGEASSG